MSVITSRTVSMPPAATSLRSSSNFTLVLPPGTTDRRPFIYSGPMQRNRPLIGIAACEVPASFGHWRDIGTVMVPSGDAHGAERAGGIPLVVPPMGRTTEPPDRRDRLVFT